MNDTILDLTPFSLTLHITTIGHAFYAVQQSDTSLHFLGKEGRGFF